MKKRIRLTESDLHRIVKESVNRVLRESIENDLDPMVLRQYGLNPNLVAKLANVNVFAPDYYDDEDNGIYSVNCQINTKNGELYIDAEGQSERGEIAANYIKAMINAMKRGYSPEEAWNYYLQNTSL